jgi:hypothetical protein
VKNFGAETVWIMAKKEMRDEIKTVLREICYTGSDVD